MEIIVIWTATSLFARLIERSWWSPSAFMALSMCVSAVGTTLFAPEYPMFIRGNIYLATLVLLASYGTSIGQLMGAKKEIVRINFQLRRPKVLFWFGMFCSTLSFSITMIVIGIRISDLTAPHSIMRAAQSATFDRYTIGLNFPIYYNISNALFLSYAMVVSIYFVQRRKVVLVYIFPIFIFVTTNMLITTRAPILFMISLMVFTALYAEYLRTGSKQFPSMFTSKVLKYFLLGALGVAGIFFVFQLLRFGEYSDRSSTEVWQHLKRWPLGSLPSFSIWFESAHGDIWDRIPGSYTLMGLFDILGLEERVTGGFGDYLYLSSTEPANIFTVFRGLFLDFGYVGSGIFMFFTGLAGGLSLRYFRNIGPFAAIAIYTAIATLFAWALIISFWAFTANILALIFMPLLATYCFSTFCKSTTQISQRTIR